MRLAGSVADFAGHRLMAVLAVHGGNVVVALRTGVAARILDGARLDGGDGGGTIVPVLTERLRGQPMTGGQQSAGEQGEYDEQPRKLLRHSSQSNLPWQPRAAAPTSHGWCGRLMRAFSAMPEQAQR